jgi:hypothetical protein
MQGGLSGAKTKSSQDTPLTASSLKTGSDGDRLTTRTRVQHDLQAAFCRQISHLPFCFSAAAAVQQRQQQRRGAVSGGDRAGKKDRERENRNRRLLAAASALHQLYTTCTPNKQQIKNDNDNEDSLDGDYYTLTAATASPATWMK